ncbi:MAG: hypothetical protein ACK4TP_09535 [Hyphomicrobium sp.]|jgi:hypothetical protein
MSNSQGPGSSYSGDGRDVAPDTQALVGLLENLVPLLLHFQSQQYGQAGPLGLGGNRGARLEQQAAVAFTEDIILDALRNLSTYLQRNASRYQGLESYSDVVADARRALAARDYQRALAQVFEAYRAIALLRAIRPELPPVRQRASDELGGGKDAFH